MLIQNSVCGHGLTFLNVTFSCTHTLNEPAGSSWKQKYTQTDKHTQWDVFECFESQLISCVSVHTFSPAHLPHIHSHTSSFISIQHNDKQMSQSALAENPDSHSSQTQREEKEIQEGSGRRISSRRKCNILFNCIHTVLNTVNALLFSNAAGVLLDSGLRDVLDTSRWTTSTDSNYYKSHYKGIYKGSQWNSTQHYDSALTNSKKHIVTACKDYAAKIIYQKSTKQ